MSGCKATKNKSARLVDRTIRKGVDGAEPSPLFRGADFSRYVANHGIDTSHFNPTVAMRRNKREWASEDIFCVDSKYPRSNLQAAVKRFDVLNYECSCCGNTGMWQGKKLDLDVDHINGDNADNRTENLRYLCPNCHRQTNTWGRKNLAP